MSDPTPAAPDQAEGPQPACWLTPEWCMEAFYRVNPGATNTMPRGIPSLYLLDFAREVLAKLQVPEPTLALGACEKMREIL